MLLTFFDAFNAGDPDGVARFIGRDFRWFAVNEPGGRHTIPVLQDYVIERHRHGERVRLLEIAVGWPDQRGVNLSVALSRQADDLAPAASGDGRYTAGKAVIDCRDQTMSVWSVGTIGPTDAVGINQLCPPPLKPVAPAAVVACTLDLPRPSVTPEAISTP
jgi:hypothetical protein